jgi:hypothetical protein
MLRIDLQDKRGLLPSATSRYSNFASMIRDPISLCIYRYVSAAFSWP